MIPARIGLLSLPDGARGRHPEFMTRRRFARALVLASLALCVDASHGAETKPGAALRVGDHVRVTLLPDSSMVTGSLLAYDASALGLRLDESSVGEDGVVARKLSRQSIAGLEVGVKHTHPWRGAFLGTLLMATAVTVAWEASDKSGEYAGMAHAFGLLFSPVICGTIGAMVGGSIEHERWQPASLPEPIAPETPTTPDR
jgi:hypothetical protein